MCLAYYCYSCNEKFWSEAILRIHHEHTCPLAYGGGLVKPSVGQNVSQALFISVNVRNITNNWEEISMRKNGTRKPS